LILCEKDNKVPLPDWDSQLHPQNIFDAYDGLFSRSLIYHLFSQGLIGESKEPGKNYPTLYSPNSTTRHYLFNKLGIPIIDRITSINDEFFNSNLQNNMALSLAFNEALTQLCNMTCDFPTRMEAFMRFLNEAYLNAFYNPWRRKYP